MREAPWLDAAWAEFGVRETPGSGNSARVLALFADAGAPQIQSDATAWCAAFVGAALKRSGLNGTGSLLARSYLKWGDVIDVPRVGAIAVLSRGNSAWQGHTAFYLGRDKSRVFLLGGNQNNAVNVAAFNAKRVLGYRWPKSDGVEHSETTQVAADPFDVALAHTLKMEGGYSNDRYDPGGPTNKGITLAVFADWRRERLTAANRAHLIANLKAIGDDDARSIYAARYWSPAGCASMPPALALMHFDAAVNHGVGTATRMLQSLVGVDADGDIGPQTRAAIGRASLSRLIERYSDARRDRYRQASTFWRFGKGWLRRVDATRAAARALLSDRADTAINDDSSANTRKDDDMRDMDYGSDDQANGKWWGHSKTIWGTLITVVSTVLPTLGPLIGIDLPADLVKEIGEKTLLALQAVGGLIGALMAIYGRVRADEPIARRNFNVKV